MSTFDPTNPASFDPSQLAELDDPYPVFDALRSAGPSLITASGLRVVTGYTAADVDWFVPHQANKRCATSVSVPVLSLNVSAKRFRPAPRRTNSRIA